MNDTNKESGIYKNHQQTTAFDDFEVAFPNHDDGISLAGTLSAPSQEGTFPAVILISGMGPNDRDYSVTGGMFATLANYLAKSGIAVLRVDKRGVGKSTGMLDSTVTSEDLARDVVAGVQFLKAHPKVDPTRIGLIGHSEGGMIAALVAAQHKEIAFVVSLTGVVVSTVQSVLEQVPLQLRADGASDELIAQDSKIRKQLLDIVVTESNAKQAEQQMNDIVEQYVAKMSEEQKEEAEKYLFAIKESNATAVVAMLNSPQYRFWLAHTSAEFLRQIKVPFLAMYGGNDCIAVPQVHTTVLKNTLDDANNQDVTILEFSGLNHWLQECKTGALAEYNPTNKISDDVLTTISDWICSRFAR